MDSAPVTQRTRIGQRTVSKGLSQIFIGLNRANFSGQLLAGITLLAIAIPEQLATSQLAGVPAFTAMIAFITATLVFFVIGSNPIVSVWADSTIAPLFAVALLRLAPASSAEYMELVAATAVVAGLIVMAIGLFKLGWLADFLSLPIVVGFMAGIGVIIITHQLPRVLGVPSGGESFISRLQWISHQFGHVSTWSVVLALGTLVVMVVGEKINAKLPWALAAVLAATILSAVGSLANHGVQQLGTVSAGLPIWRLHWVSGSEWGTVCTTALTLVIVILSQSAATSRTTASVRRIALLAAILPAMGFIRPTARPCRRCQRSLTTLPTTVARAWLSAVMADCNFACRVRWRRTSISADPACAAAICASAASPIAGVSINTRSN